MAVFSGIKSIATYMKRMNRRKFLKTIGAISLSPLLPTSLIAGAAGTSTATTAVVTDATYSWAEAIIRAHGKCNFTMVQRLLGLDNSTATALKSQLFNNGVISSKTANGMVRAAAPLYREIMPKTSSPEKWLKQEWNNDDNDSSDMEADDQIRHKEIINDEDNQENPGITPNSPEDEIDPTIELGEDQNKNSTPTQG